MGPVPAVLWAAVAWRGVGWGAVLCGALECIPVLFAVRCGVCVVCLVCVVCAVCVVCVVCVVQSARFMWMSEVSRATCACVYAGAGAGAGVYAGAVNCELRVAGCGLRAGSCGLRVASCELRTVVRVWCAWWADRGERGAEWGLGVGGWEVWVRSREGVGCYMQNLAGVPDMQNCGDRERWVEVIDV